MDNENKNLGDTNTNQDTTVTPLDIDKVVEEEVTPEVENQQEAPGEIVNSTSQSTPASKPQVVKVEKEKEKVVVKEVAVKDDKEKVNTSNQNVAPQEEVPTKKGHPIIIAFLVIILFSFVYFLPQITDFVTAYLNRDNDPLELKSGTLTCNLTRETENLETTIEQVFTYQQNKLKTQETTSNYRLSANALSNEILTTRQEECTALENVVTEFSGLSVSCNVTAALQKTVQTIDYTKLSLEAINQNIAEFNGFYPEYELDQSAMVIKEDLEDANYTCTVRER